MTCNANAAQRCQLENRNGAGRLALALVLVMALGLALGLALALVLALRIQFNSMQLPGGCEIDLDVSEGERNTELFGCSGFVLHFPVG